jgi:ParB family chromosome partitioning protein
MNEAAQQVISKKLSVRDTEKLVKKIKSFGFIAPKTVTTEVDPNLETLANALTQRLGAKARVLPKGQGGKIELGYQNLDDLDRLLELLGVSV